MQSRLVSKRAPCFIPTHRLLQSDEILGLREVLCEFAHFPLHCLDLGSLLLDYTVPLFDSAHLHHMRCLSPPRLTFYSIGQ